jgi:hypothetical protein
MENGGEHVRMHGHHGRTTPTVLGSALPLQCRTLEASRDGLGIYAMVCKSTIREITLGPIYAKICERTIGGGGGGVALGDVSEIGRD